MLEGLILKPNMVLPGLNCTMQEFVEEVVDATLRCLLLSVPAAVSGVEFLSGGQSAELASARLNPMNVRFKERLPWALSFSFASASNNQLWRFGVVRMIMLKKLNKLFFIAQAATEQLAENSILEQWKKDKC